MAISTAPFVLVPLSPLDCCDRCNAAALVKATLPNGGELQFCGFHVRAHEARLREIGAGLSSAV